MTHKKLLERNRKITDALQNGAKVTDLAQEHGLSPQTVYHIAQAEMEKRRKVTFTEWKDNRNDEIRNQYQEGISAEELAKAFNLNRATIFRILKEGGAHQGSAPRPKVRPALPPSGLRRCRCPCQ